MRRATIIAAIAAVSASALAVVAILNAAVIAGWWTQLTASAGTARPSAPVSQPTAPAPSPAMVAGPWYCRLFAFAEGEVQDYDSPPSYRFPYRDVGWITFVDAKTYEYRSAFEPANVFKGDYVYDRGKAQIRFTGGRFAQFYPKEAVYDPARYPGFLLFATDYVVDCRVVRA